MREKELKEKISGLNRVRRIALTGLVIGIVLIVAGLLLLPELYIIGLTLFIVCTGITSFIFGTGWQYKRALKAKAEERKTKPIQRTCPRCGAEVEKDEKYCPKCGKSVQTKKR